MCDPAFRRAQQIKIKSEATWVAFLELDGLINKSKLAEQYFNKSQAWLSHSLSGLINKTQLSEQYFERTQSWFSQKLNGCEVCNKERSFTPAEYHQLAEAFRHIARRLEQHAAEIDAASIDEE